MNKTWTELMTEARAKGPVTPEELTAFVAAVSEKVSFTLKATYPGCEANHEFVELGGKGAKFAKLVRRHPRNTGGSSYCFIELATGDILKAASWKTPAKHARGNIRNGDASNWWDGALQWTGATYLK